MAKRPTTPHKSFQERLDPGGETGQMARFFSSPVGRLLARVAGVRAEDAKELRAQYERLMSAPDHIAGAVGSLGWIFFESAPVEEYVGAATLVEQGEPDKAEQLLVEFWNSDARWQERPIHRLFGLYGADDDELVGIREGRERLLRKALDYHRQGEYAASIPITLAQMDGIFKDFTGKSSKEFFDPRNPELVDDETLAGHPLGLQALSKMMSRGLKKSGSTGSFFRHAILHGQELGYDTQLNSTKIWAALLAVIDAMKPRADRMAKERQTEHERRIAGSKEVDTDGRRVDNRGFYEAKGLLLELAGYEQFFYKGKGRYAASRDELASLGFTLRGPEFEIAVEPDGREYRAWVETPGQYFFAIAGRDGEQVANIYEGEEPPLGGLDSGADWRNFRDDPAPPNW
jgi:hypothetical protein